MGMNIGSGEGSEPDVLMDSNTTPLIDVMLVLIIMLIITIPVQLHSVNLNLPQGAPPPALRPPEVVTVVVDAQGAVWWNGEKLPDQATLETRLARVAGSSVPIEIHLRPDGQASYGAFARVLASAQRLGVTQLGVVGNEQFAP
jgi:biopolymer transport protein ExbD